ncbi:MAG: M23 family metallopeptidase, partial [Rubricoccaceae bacterium]|nr:M23 family metallopeptidase [Rubricoccaceae bacterium]
MSRTIILLDPASIEAPRQYDVKPQTLLFIAGGASLLSLILISFLLFATPLRNIIRGGDLADFREMAELNAVRAAAFEDSVAIQYRQITQLRALITGDLDSLTSGIPVSPDPVFPEQAQAEAELGVTVEEAITRDWADHQQPAVPFRWLDATGGEEPLPGSAAEAYLTSLRLPALPPVSGFLTRGFNARMGHFAVDIATAEGTPVRVVGEGYVVFSDWTHGGGFVVAV